jgi:hypothetical protein
MSGTSPSSFLRFGILLSILPLFACTPAVSVPQAEYQSTVATIKLGISRQEFLKLFPKAEARGAKSFPKGSVEVLEVVVYRYHFGPTSEPEWNTVPGGQVKKVWFYFYNDKLVQFGNPNDWPQNPDLIVELRHT